MLAFSFSLLLFLWFTFLGGAVLNLLRPWRSSLRTMLAAPGAGAAALVLPVFVLNRAGYPVRQFALPLTIVLLAVSALLYWRIRPAIAWKRLVPFLCVLLCGALAVGYPLFADGFNWISYGNNDMCSFVMTAHHFADHGYNELPDRAAFLGNRDIGATYWFSYAIEGSRCGSDLLLAWLISLTHRTGFEVYMPALLALHLALIAAAGALMLGSSRRLAALAVCAWLAISPLTTLGTMYQLMPQVFGMTLLAIAAAFLLRPVRIANFSSAARFSLLAGGLVAMLAVAYYEILPFLIVAVAIYHTVRLLRRRENIRSTALAAAGAALVVLIFLRSWALLLVPFLERQAGRSFQSTNADASVFPYYLIPSGLANLWGFLPIGAGVPSGRLADLAILAGGLLLAAAIAACAWQACKARPAGILACVMLAVGVRLFLDRGDFGLFKLAMYLQPFLLGSLVLAWFGVAKTKLWRFVPLAIVAALGLRSQIYYVQRSLGTPGSFVNLPYASREALLAQLARLRGGNNVPIVSDTDNVILASLESIYLNPANVEFPAGDFFQHAANLDPGSPQFRMSQRLAPELSSHALALAQARQAMDGTAVFDLKNPADGPRTNVFFHWNGKHYSNSALLETGPELSILNHRQIPDRAGAIFIPNAEHANRLIPVASELGGSQFLAERFGPDHGVALYSSEPDYFFPGSMAALGRYLLFRVLNASPRIRLVLDYTASLNADGENRIPPAVVIGDMRVPFAVQGRGAARLFSEPLTPQKIDGESYLMLDLGEVPFRMPTPRSGLMTLYGRDIRLDTRQMTGFARDISAISEEDYTALRAPAGIAKFPAALHDPNLEFSGIYEDGWASEDVSLTLDAPESSTLRLSGMAPQGLEITLLVDGRMAARQSFRAGEFTLAAPQTFAPGRHRVEIHSSSTLRLAAPDTRLASFLVHRIGFGGK